MFFPIKSAWLYLRGSGGRGVGLLRDFVGLGISYNSHSYRARLGQFLKALSGLRKREDSGRFGPPQDRFRESARISTEPGVSTEPGFLKGGRDPLVSFLKLTIGITVVPPNILFLLAYPLSYSHYPPLYWSRKPTLIPDQPFFFHTPLPHCIVYIEIKLSRHT